MMFAVAGGVNSRQINGTPIDISAAAFAGQDEAFMIASPLMLAYATKEVSDAMAYKLVKAFWENKATLVEKAAWWESASPDLLDKVSTPFPPGAFKLLPRSLDQGA